MSGSLNMGEFADGEVGPVGSTAPTQAALVGGVDGSGNLQGISTDASGKQNINNISGTVSLPTGASTSALQTTGNTSVASIDTKTPTLGQKVMASSSPVAIASDQSAIPATQSGTWNINNVSGTVSLPTGASTSTLQTTGNTSLSNIDGKLNTLGQKAMSASMPVTIASDQTAVPASQSGTWNINNVSGTVSLPTGAATSALQTTGNTSLSSIDTKTPALVSGRVPVDGSGVTQPISAVSLPLPTGASTSALQTTANTSLSSIDSKTPALGQAAMAASVPVVIASNQSAVSVTPTAYSYFHPIYTTRVQSVTGATGSATTTLAINIASSRAASLIAVAVSSSVASTVTVTDNLSQSYSTAISGTSTTHTNYIFYKANSSAGVTTVTITSTVNSALCAVVTEYFGVSTSPLDKTATANVTSASFSSGATATTTSAVELLLGSAYGTTKNNSTYTAGTSWTTVGLSNGFNAAAGQLYLEEQFVTATGAYTATGTASASDTIITDIATFIVNGAANLTALNSAKVIKSGAGTLASFIINTPGTGGATATLYDGLSTTGTIIAVISLVNAGTVNVAMLYNLSFTTGLTIVLNSSTADITVTYA